MLTQAGAEDVAYVPNTAYNHLASTASARRLGALPRTRLVLPWEPYFKLEPTLLALSILIALVAFPRPNLRDEIDGSPVATGLREYAPLTLSILPDDFDQTVDAFLDGVTTAPEEAPAGTPTPVQ